MATGFPDLRLLIHILKGAIVYEQLGTVTLKDGEHVEAGVVIGPDLDWADRVEELLGHKGPSWRWGNSMALREALPLEAYYYLVHRDGVPFANMMNIEVGGVGLYGHVYTRPEERRKGAARQLLHILLEHYRERGGRALVLGTGYDSPPYHIYAGGGFASIEAESGCMAYYPDGESNFYDAYFADQSMEISRLDWCHWPSSIPLFIGDFPGSIRSAVMRVYGRESTEGPIVRRMEEELARIEEGRGPQTAVLTGDETGAVFGLATCDGHPIWPGSCLVDLYCHPSAWERGVELMNALELNRADRIIAYCDTGLEEKETILDAAGYRPVATYDKRIAADAAGMRHVDVREWERR